ncbi:response regulator aspartate phosphatase [Bacillus mycoides]
MTNTNEGINSLLKVWYENIIRCNINEALQIKTEINKRTNENELNLDQRFYLELFNFRYQVLTDGLSINKRSFDHIDSMNLPASNSIQFYYHFFKGIHRTILSDYNDAKIHFEQAEEFITSDLNELEKAEFMYRQGTYLYQTYQPLLAIEKVTEAKDILLKHNEYNVLVALCENVYGLSCIDLRQYNLAEESFDAAIDILRRESREELLLRVRSNIGWLYENQNLLSSAIRHLSEVNSKIANHVRALFSEAEAHFKLGETLRAEELINRGINVSKEIDNKEYLHRFLILEQMNKLSNTNELEKVVIEGIQYFEQNNLLDAVYEYTEKLAIRFHEENNYRKASEYFYQSTVSQKKTMEKGALK